MNKVTIKDIYAGMPDAKDENNATMINQFFESFILPPGLNIDELLSGRKSIVTGYKGVGKTSVLFYLQNKAHERDASTCSSFIQFKSDYNEIKRSQLETVAKKLTAIVDVCGEIQPNKVEYLYIWKWVFFNRIVDDSIKFNSGLFEDNDDWRKFIDSVKSIRFSGNEKGIISLSSLSITAGFSSKEGVKIEGQANLEINKDMRNFQKFTEIVDKCEELFNNLKRTSIPYYVFVDELEAFYDDIDRFKRDLMLIRDLLFTIIRLNATEKVKIIVAVRTEILSTMGRWISTNELNKATLGYSVPIRWSYSNTTSTNHPIIKVLMRRISMATPGIDANFYDWFPREMYGKDTVKFILDNCWNRPRDIVRLITVAQNDSLHCNDTEFSQAAFDSFLKEYSKESFEEIKQELQTLYTPDEIRIAEQLFRGKPRCVYYSDMKSRAKKGSAARALWDKRGNDIVNDFYRAGVIGNINRQTNPYTWRWEHKQDMDVLTDAPWELVVHAALCKYWTISYLI